MLSDTSQLSDPFALPMNNLDDAQAIVLAIEALLSQRKLGLHSPPPVPSTCCGVGCSNCVWQGYFEALANWRDQARTLCADAGRVQVADHLPRSVWQQTIPRDGKRAVKACTMPISPSGLMSLEM